MVPTMGISCPAVANNETERQTDMDGPIRCSLLMLEHEEHLTPNNVIPEHENCMKIYLYTLKQRTKSLYCLLWLKAGENSHVNNTLSSTRMTNHAGNSGTVPEIKSLFHIPESIPNVLEIIYFF
jgi:hypothetical protein